MRTFAFVFALFALSLPTTPQDFAPGVAGGTLYALPLTTIRIEVRTVNYRYYPGPFANFSEKYLGVKPTITSEENSAIIESIHTEAIAGADPESYFRVNIARNNPVWDNIATLTTEGLITRPDNLPDQQVYTNFGKQPDKRIVFDNLSIHGMFNTRLDTSYITENQDTTTIQIPVVKKVAEAKTGEEKAREAADFIFKLRKRKSKLLTGQYEIMPDGPAIEALLPEVNKIESEYLSLFLGKTIADTIVRYYELIPVRGRENSYILATFNDETGLLNPSNKEGTNLVAELTPTLKTGASKPTEEVKPTAKQAIVRFRTADISRLRIRLGQQVLYETRIPVFQLGFEESFVVENGR